MTTLLEKAFAEAAKLSEAEQNLLARWLLDELAAEDAFDRRIEQTSGKLAGLARQALNAHRCGETGPLDPDRL